MGETSPSVNLLSALRCGPDAQATLRGSEKHPALRGVVRFYQTKRGVLVFAQVSGLPAAAEPCGGRFFAFHIHRGGQCSGDSADPFANALTHYDPGACPHPAHAGDLPPLLADHGSAFQITLTDRFTVREIVGRTVIMHAGPDDFTTQPGGGAGSRIACGQIKASAPRGSRQRR